MNGVPTVDTGSRSVGGPVFAFFSSRLGCLGSILVSLLGTLLLLAILSLTGAWG